MRFGRGSIRSFTFSPTKKLATGVPFISNAAGSKKNHATRRRLDEAVSLHEKVNHYMGVSKNTGTSKSSILIGVFPYFHHPFWGFSPYFWKHPYGHSNVHETTKMLIVESGKCF